MKKNRIRGEDVRKFILDQVDEHPEDINKVTALHFDISRQAVHKHLQGLTAEQILSESGQTRNKAYHLAPLLEWRQTYKILPGLAEDVVWRTEINPLLGNIPNNALNIWHYGFTEMFNNAIEHSGGSEISVEVKKTAVTTEIFIKDDGLGIFKKIQTAFNLLDERHALLELSKGKLTTDPKQHSGQGIFFTSRMLDFYIIRSGQLEFTHEHVYPEDFLISKKDQFVGTSIQMQLCNDTVRTCKEIFDQYTAGEEENYGFNKTVVPIRLAQYGNEWLVSRSQAKRILTRIELFERVILDFTGVDSIGQAFADEIFRVFALQHPNIQLTPAHANAEVMQMIKRAQTTRQTDISPKA